MQARERQAQVLSDEIAAIDRALADQGLYERDPAQAQELAAERGRIAKALEAAEADWLTASEAYEEAMQQAS